MRARQRAKTARAKPTREAAAPKAPPVSPSETVALPRPESLTVEPEPGAVPIEAHQKAADYTLAKGRFGLLDRRGDCRCTPAQVLFHLLAKPAFAHAGGDVNCLGETDLVCTAMAFDDHAVQPEKDCAIHLARIHLRPK